MVAPFILNKIQQNQHMPTAMSFWTFTDLFEEIGIPPSSFHGGFGLLNIEGIRKSSYFAYKYLQMLEGKQIDVKDDAPFVTTADDKVTAVVWDYQPSLQTKSNRSTYYQVFPTVDIKPLQLKLTGLKAGKYKVTVHRTGFRTNDSYTAYIEMGSPKDLSPEQIDRLHQLSADKPEVITTLDVGTNGVANYRIPMRANDVLFIKLELE
jgi:xylan 1,4-beta-xylosidase